MNERLINQGRITDLNLKKRSLELSIKGLVQTLRLEADPFKSIDEMNEEMIGEQALELSQKINEFKAVSRDIAGIKKVWGI